MKKSPDMVVSALMGSVIVVFVLELFEYSYFAYKWIEFRDGVNATTSQLSASIVLVIAMGFFAAIGLLAAMAVSFLSNQKTTRKTMELLVWCVALRICLIFIGMTFRLGDWPDSLLRGKTPSILAGGVASIVVLLIWRRSGSR